MTETEQVEALRKVMREKAYPAVTRLLAPGEVDTVAGSALREVLWSLYNPAYPAQLWVAVTDLDQAARREVALLIILNPEDRERVLRDLLQAGGEMERIDCAPTRGQALWVRRPEGEGV